MTQTQTNHKFRVRDTQEGKYTDKKYFFIDCDGELWIAKFIDLVNLKLYRVDPARYIVEWFSGKRDTDKKDVYLNDKVQFRDPAGIWRTGCIVYNQEELIYEIKEDDLHTRNWQLIQYIGTVTIIGNRHDNPDLLKGATE